MRFDKVVVCGAGGTSSYLIDPLLRTLTFHDNGTLDVHLWDGDVFEQSNTSRQAFDKRYLGVNKARAFYEMYKSTFPFLKVHEKFIYGSDLERLITESRVVVDGLLVISLVDNEASICSLVGGMDNIDDQTNIAFICPGNGLDEGNVFCFTRFGGRWCPGHPLEKVPQWKESLGGALPGACGYVSESSPQLINANMGGAWLTLNYVLALLNDWQMPPRTDFSLRSFKSSPAGCSLKQMTPTNNN